MLTYNIWYQIIIIATILKLGVSEMSLEQREKMFIKMAEECRASLGATEQDVLDVHNLIAPTTRIGRCFNRCIMEMFGMIENEKFHVKSFIALVKMAHGKNNKEMINVARVIGERCSEITHSDGCELSILLMQCVANGAEDQGVDRRTFG